MRRFAGAFLLNAACPCNAIGTDFPCAAFLPVRAGSEAGCERTFRLLNRPGIHSR